MRLKNQKLLAFSFLAFGFAVTLPGCYSHVVRAEGATPGRYEVYEPNLKLPEEEAKATRKDKQEAAERKKFLGIF